MDCLENVVHRRGDGLQETCRVMVIEVPADCTVNAIAPESLPPDWYVLESYGYCQQLGYNWLQRGESAIPGAP